jgi:hypothetical protein
MKPVPTAGLKTSCRNTKDHAQGYVSQFQEGSAVGEGAPVFPGTFSRPALQDVRGEIQNPFEDSWHF